MRFQYLGTAAAEGWPALFCNCEFCKEAARRGGKDIRTRSQSIINEDLLIDLPADTYMHKLQQGLDLSAVKYLLITHKHCDHFYPQELTVRGSGYAHGMVSEDLDIYLSKESLDMYRLINWEADEETEKHLRFHVIHAFDTFQAGPYKVTALPARHMREDNDPFVYHIEDLEGRSVLYLHDTGYLLDEVWEYLDKLKTPFSMVSFDACFGPRATERGGHMGIPECGRVKERMEAMGVIDKETVCVVNHFSHNCYAMHDDMERMSEKMGMLTAFDGMRIEI